MSTANPSRGNARAVSRGPGLTNLAIGLILMLIIVPLALRISQPPPPPIAEFAPEARHEIVQSQQQGDTGHGSGHGGGVGGLPTGAPQPTPAGASPTPAQVDVAGVKKCVDGPGGPRQIEDPQSPPCVDYWEGKNGGATAKGVTDSTITIVYVLPQAALPDADQDPYVQDFANFFNQRFEFYQRHINLVEYTPAGQGQTPSSALAAQDAAAINTKYSPFAVIDYASDWHGESYYFYDDLARDGIISSAADENELPYVTQSHYDAYAPYEWNYFPAMDQDQVAQAAQVCRQMAGHPTSFAGAGIDTTAPRKWGVVYENYTDGTPPLDIQPLLDRLKQCGVTPETAGLSYTGDANQGTQAAKQAMGKFQSDGVTSVFFLGHPSLLAYRVWTAADADAYYPEWLLSDVIHNDTETLPTLEADKDQIVHSMALVSYNKYLQPSYMPYYDELKLVDPGANVGSNVNYSWLYENLLLVASGIQMAGPHLTPQTFQDGLFHTRFPNPWADGAPYYQARVGFGPGDHSMIQSYALAWPDETQQSVQFPGNGLGMYCFFWQGLRYTADTWPAQLPPRPPNGRCP